MILYTEKDKGLYTTVPNIVGLDVSVANQIIANANLNIKISNLSSSNTGGAIVNSQSIAYGTVVPENTVLELEIIYLDFED